MKTNSEFVPRRNPLKTFQLSDSRFERDGLRQITIKSASLRGRGDISVWMPPAVDITQPLPLVILLHGVYGSHWAWSMNGGAHITARRLLDSGQIRQMALVMPSDGLWGDGSGYVNHSGRDYESWIAEEVPWAVRQIVAPKQRTNTPLFISGLSMGGFGAMRIGAKYGANHFKGISGHSSVTEFSEMKKFVEEPLNLYANVSPDDLSVLNTILANRQNLPPLRFDCGQSDPLRRGNRALHSALETNGIPHIYEEFKGTHEWAYWEAHLTDTLLFFETCMR